MTTILFDSKEHALYSDSRSTANTRVVSSRKQKISVIHHPELGECLIGCAGINECITVALAFLENGGEKPSIDEFESILITKDWRLFNVYAKQLIPVLIPYENDCIGSGSQIAAAVLHATSDALLAMKTARELDVCTGGAIQKGWFDGEQWRIETVLD